MNGHRVVGEALEQVYRGAIDAHLPELAHHFLSAALRGDLAKAVEDAEGELGDGARRLLYLSVPPGAMKGMVEELGRSGLTERARLVAIDSILRATLAGEAGA